MRFQACICWLPIALVLAYVLRLLALVYTAPLTFDVGVQIPETCVSGKILRIHTRFFLHFR